MTDTASQRIDARITELGDWRGDVLAQVRAAIRAADPAVVEDMKWQKPTNPAGVPVWEHAGILCTGETYKNYMKLTFARGAALEDPAGLFNASLSGGTRRAIDIRARVNTGNTFTIHHGASYQNANFDDVLTRLRRHLPEIGHVRRRPP